MSESIISLESLQLDQSPSTSQNATGDWRERTIRISSLIVPYCHDYWALLKRILSKFYVELIIKEQRMLKTIMLATNKFDKYDVGACQ